MIKALADWGITVRLIEAITKKKIGKDLSWIDLARDSELGAIRVNPDEMKDIYGMTLEFRGNRASYGKESLDYYKPALDRIESEYTQRNFEEFKTGLGYLLGLIGDD
ncbi:MAG: hypothetical protein Q7S27_00615 [Nanoarchaeota archaeon]|nr:hypothetical protein [Nanoarchaeota archaeon]